MSGRKKIQVSAIFILNIKEYFPVSQRLRHQIPASVREAQNVAFQGLGPRACLEGSAGEGPLQAAGTGSLH